MTIPNWLAHRHDIGYNILGLEAPEVRTDPPKAHLHFVGNADAPRIAHMAVCLLEIAIWENDLAATAQQRFTNECSHLILVVLERCINVIPIFLTCLRIAALKCATIHA